jgi:hypothetical protein
MATFYKTLSSKITTNISMHNPYTYKLEIVEQFTFDKGPTENEIILEFGKSFDSMQTAEAFIKTAQFRSIFKTCKTMKTFKK